MKRQAIYFNKIKKLKTISSLLLTTTIFSSSIAINSIIKHNNVNNQNTELKIANYELSARTQNQENYIYELELLNGEELKRIKEIKITVETDIGYGITPLPFFSSWISKQSFAHLENYFIGYGMVYNIDPGFAAATFVIEVGRRADSLTWKKNHNPAGIKTFNNCKVVNGYCKYDSEQEGIEAMYQLLSLYYTGKRFGKQLTTVDEVRTKWSEAVDEELTAAIWNEIIGG